MDIQVSVLKLNLAGWYDIDIAEEATETVEQAFT